MTPSTRIQTAVSELFALRPGVYSGRAPDGRMYLFTSTSVTPMPLGRLDPALHTVLRRLAGPAATEQELRAHLPHDNGAVPGDGPIRRMLRQLQAHGLLATTIACDGRPRYTLVSERPPSGPAPAAAPAQLVLSRFTLLRRDGEQVVMESPRSWCRVQIEDPELLTAAGVLHPVPSSRGSDGRLPQELVDRLRRDLWWAGMMVDPEAEEGEFRIRQWSPHELWFHSRSRLGRRSFGDRFGRTWWARGVFDPLPAVHDPFSNEGVDLYRPDLDALRASDPPLSSIIEDRRTIRTHDDDAPLTVEQLGGFLYRCSRNRGRMVYEGVEYLSRPHPAGGGVYELELYPVVRHVAGLAAGMYHYDPERHRLELVCRPNASTQRLLRHAAVASAARAQPQVLLVIAARFGRLMWTYESMPYALILKHVGVLYQTMYLVATAMGLAPCGLGAGDSDVFAEATGLDPLVEGSVGEFMLGSRRPADRDRKAPS